MAQPTLEIDKPWHVVTTDGAFHSGHDSESFAQVRCDKANEDALALGIKGRYEVQEKA